MITVVHIITALGSGGAERVLYRVASTETGARDIRHIVISLADEGIYGPKLRAAGVDVFCLGMRPTATPFGALAALVRLLRRTRPDVVMTWLYHADLMGTLAGRLAGVRRIVWNIRCSDMDFSRYAATTRWVVRILARLSGVPWAIAANSEAGRLAHAALGYRPQRWIYLPNGFDTELWKPDEPDRTRMRAKLGFAETDRVVGVIARVDPQKDHATFFAAMERLIADHPDVRILLAGKGTDDLAVPQSLRNITRALGERADIPVVIRTLDIFVSSSAYGEGFPNVIAEAMATGVPPVATDVGDSAAIVGDAGRIVPPDDPLALAAAIGELLSASSEALRDMGRHSRQRIERTFTIAESLARYRELFRQAAS